MKKSKSALFLMEMIIVVFFFSLTVAVCMRVFVKAHTVGRDTQALNSAVLWAENACELFYEYGSDFDEHKDMVLSQVTEDFRVDLTTRDDGDYLYLDYACYASYSDEPVYSVTCKKHIQEVSE